MFTRNYTRNQTFNHLFLITTLFVTTIPLFLSYSRAKSNKRLDHLTTTVQNPLFDQSGVVVVGVIMLLILLVQTLVIKIPNHSLDEYAYIYMARNLLDDNTNFTATPPWLNKMRYKPRYVFVTLLAVFCSFFRFEFASTELVIIASNLMLIPIVFATAATFFERKVGIVAATLMAINPVFWHLSTRIYPDIPAVAFSWASLYFLLRAFKNGKNVLVEQKFVFLSFFFLLLALYTKYAAILLLPAFFLLSFIYSRNRIANGSKRVSSFLSVIFMLLFSLVLALVRFWSYIINYPNLPMKSAGWNFQAIYDTMINPLGPFSQFSALILFGVFLSLKSKWGKRNLATFFATWAGYVPFFLLFPHFIPEKRHVFSQQVSAIIIAAFGVVSISKQRKLWKISLLVLILAHALDELLEWKATRQSSLYFEAFLLIIVLVLLRDGIRRTARKNALAARSLQTTILLGLTLLAFANAAFLDSHDVSWEEQVRDESRDHAVFFLKTVGGWLQTHVTENESIMTNAYATLPYYAGFVTTYVPPQTEEQFLSSLNQINMTYLVIFWGTYPFLRHVLGGMTIPDEASYLERYVWNPPSSTRLVYSDTAQTMDAKEVGVVIFETL